MANLKTVGFITLLGLLLFGITACVGLGASFPSTNIVSETRSDSAVFFYKEVYVPRKPLEGETIEIGPKKGTYRYSKGPSECYQHIVIIPMWFGDCRQQEVWSKNNTNTFTVIRKAYHLWGFWCSPFPLFAAFPSLLTGTESKFSLCDLHLGSPMHTKNHF